VKLFDYTVLDRHRDKLIISYLQCSTNIMLNSPTVEQERSVQWEVTK